MATSAGVSVESDPAVELRDRILAAFLADRTAVFTRRDERVACLRVPSGAVVMLIACPAGATPSELKPTFDAATQGHKAGVAHVVAVGGDEKVAKALKKTAPFWQTSTRFGFHHVEPGGDVSRLTGARFGQLEDMVRKAADTPALPEADLAVLLAQGAERQREEVQLDTALRGRFPWVTVTLVAICTVLFALGKLWSTGSLIDSGNYFMVLDRMGANSGVDVKAGELWRILASAFLHANFEHILFNMAALATFGPVLERLLGPQRYIALYGLSALGGGLASALLRGPGISVGASGAIWGLMAAGVGLALRPRDLLPPTRLARARRQTMIPLAINVLYSFSPGIDLFAHFGGGLVGFALMASGLITRGVTPLWTTSSDAAPEQRSPPALNLLAAALGLALIGSVVIALVAGRPWTADDPPELTRVQVADTGVSIKIPRDVAGAPKEQTEQESPGLRIFTFLKPGKVSVQVLIVPPLQPEPLPPEQIDEVLQTEKKVFEDTAVPEAQREGDATLVTIAGRRFATVTHRMNNKVLIRSWVSIFGNREIILRIFSPPDRPASWTKLDDEIVASLQVP